MLHSNYSEFEKLIVYVSDSLGRKKDRVFIENLGGIQMINLVASEEIKTGLICPVFLFHSCFFAHFQGALDRKPKED